MSSQKNEHSILELTKQQLKTKGWLKNLDFTEKQQRITAGSYSGNKKTKAVSEKDNSNSCV